MALDREEFHHLTPVWRWQPCRRRRRVQTVWLGERRPRRTLLLAKMLRKMRLRWLKLKYFSMLRKLKEHYRNVVKDVIEAGSSIEILEQRLFIESVFVIPAGFTFSSYSPLHLAPHRPRTFFI